MTAILDEPVRALLRDPDGGDPPSDGGSRPDGQPESTVGDSGRALICKACRTKITRRDLAMEIEGKHEHVFFNPHGYVFELGCFASAKNIVIAGPKTDEFTWFPGYSWEVIACAGCGIQLGWRYTSHSGGFFGLILPNLMEEPLD